MGDCIEKFPCRKCNKNFSAKFALKKHERYCCEIAPVECEKCNSVYKNMHSLRTHKTRCLGYYKQYRCTICKESFDLNVMFRNHMRVFHGVTDVPVATEPVSNTGQIKYPAGKNMKRAVNNVKSNENAKDIDCRRFGRRMQYSWNEPICKLEYSHEEPFDTCEKILPDDGDMCGSSERSSMYFKYESSSEEETESKLVDYLFRKAKKMK